jgi:hypothetical protein
MDNENISKTGSSFLVSSEIVVFVFIILMTFFVFGLAVSKIFSPKPLPLNVKSVD